MDLKKLKYSKEWLEYEILQTEQLTSQNLAFDTGEDKNTEHFRYKSFLNWIDNNIDFTDTQIQQFLHLVEIDDDQAMTSSAVCNLYTSTKLSKPQKEVVKKKLISFGAWAVRFVEKHEAKFKEAFNEKFCDFLEYHLCQTFRKSDDKSIRSLWCDGVICAHFSRKHVNDNRKITTMAWIGKDGQTEYEMTLKFGKYALRRYARGSEMIDCIPSSDSMDWVKVNIETNKITIQLK